MHYYQFNIADYRKDTGHLSLLEHGIYRQLLDSYYLDEKPIETQVVIRRLLIKTHDEGLALDNVLNDFFTVSECGEFYYHKRVIREISNYNGKAETARANGAKGGRPKKPRKTQPVNLGSENKPRQKLTINHKPLTNNHKLNTKDKPLVCDISESTKSTKSTSGESGDNNKKHYVGNESEKLFDKFWQAGMKKVNKPAAKKSFFRELKKQSAKDSFVDMLILDVQKRLSLCQLGFDNMHPTTYLNNQRWEDEHEKSNGINQQSNGSASDAAAELRRRLGQSEDIFAEYRGTVEENGSVVASYGRAVRS